MCVCVYICVLEYARHGACVEVKGETMWELVLSFYM